jgi:putative FmdB family regulatory protein
VPTYQYACTACGHRFDAVQSFSDASLTDCPECAGRLRKVFSSVGIVFKGSGFYRTDSRSAGGEKGEKAGADSSGSDSSSKNDGGSSKDGGSTGKNGKDTAATSAKSGSTNSGSGSSGSAKSTSGAGASTGS